MRTLWFGLVTITLAACSRGSSAPAIGSTGPGTAPAPTLFSGLFAGDRTLIYDVTGRTSFWDDQDPKADANGNVNGEWKHVVTCKLDVETVGRYRVAISTCNDDDGDGNTRAPRVVDQLQAAFITDGTALWRTDLTTMPTAVAEVEAARTGKPALTIDQQPVRVEEQGSDGPDFGSVYEIVPANDGWCVSENSWGGDEGGASWCISAADGLVFATWFFAGGSSQDEDAVLRR